MTKKHSKKNQLLEERLRFSLKLIFGFPIVGLIWTGIIYFLSDVGKLNFNIAYCIGGIGITLGIITLLSESIFRWVWRGWCKLIFLVDTSIIWLTLPIFYYIIFSPFALILRALGKVNMKKKSSQKETFWRLVKQPDSDRQYLRQF